MKRQAIISVLLLLALASCNDGFLDRYPQDKVTDDNFWQTEDHLKAAVNVLTDSFMGKDWLNRTEIMCDNVPWAVTTAWRTIGAGHYATDISQINSVWTGRYNNIGRANYFLNNYRRAVSVKPEIRERYAAEAYFYRAYNYWLLTSYFGDVPYITDELNINSPDVFRGRDPRDSVVAWVCRDLEAHYRDLPEYISAASSEFGRVSQAAALVLLSRLYLYNGLYDKSIDASERVMNGPYHELYSTGNPDMDYLNLFNYKGRASRHPENHETILAIVFNDNLGAASYTHNLSREISEPTDFVRWVPTKSMVECYLTDAGQIWNPKTCNSYAEVFEHRDPRMKQSIFSPGTIWLGAGESMTESVFEKPKFSNTKNGAMTYSGYYCRKYAELSAIKRVGHDDNDIVMMRYGEVLLNYAEAKELAGQLTQHDLDISINLLRDRVGMVHMELDKLPEGSDIRTEIRRERRVEMFFEGFRFFDIIRWREGYRLGEDLLGVNRRWLAPEDLVPGLVWKNVGGEQYLVIETGRSFSEKNYLLSVPFAQMQLNPNLKPNNPGWE